MKLSQCCELRELVLADKKTFPTKERGKATIYGRLKKNILERIEFLEALKKKEMKYLADVDEYLGKIEKQYKVTFELKGLSLGNKAEANTFTGPGPADKFDGQRQSATTTIPPSSGESRVGGGNGAPAV